MIVDATVTVLVGVPLEAIVPVQGPTVKVGAVWCLRGRLWLHGGGE